MRHVFDNALQAISNLRDKTISAVISHSQQAKEITELRERMEALTQRMTSVVNEAQQIRQDLHSVIVERDKYKTDAEEAHKLATIFESERDEARQQANDRRVELERAQHDFKTSQDEVVRLEANLKRASDNLKWTTELNESINKALTQRNQEFTELQNRLKTSEDRLSRLQGVMKDIFPVAETASPKSVEDLPGIAPSFQPHPVQYDDPNMPQSAPEEQGGVNERIDGQEPKPETQYTGELPWWKKDKQAF